MIPAPRRAAKIAFTLAASADHPSTTFNSVASIDPRATESQYSQSSMAPL